MEKITHTFQANRNLSSNRVLDHVILQCPLIVEFFVSGAVKHKWEFPENVLFVLEKLEKSEVGLTSNFKRFHSAISNHISSDLGPKLLGVNDFGNLYFLRLSVNEFMA